MPELPEGEAQAPRGPWRGRPPWWPEGEDWPPSEWPARWRGGPPWRRMRGRFFVRVALFIALLVILAVGAGTAMFLLLASAIGAAFPAPHAGLFVLVALLLVVFLSGAVRRAAGPVGDLIEAAGRVEAGDYATRVPERGARELRGLS